MGFESEEPNKFIKKIKEDPTVPIGLIGLLGIVGYGFYNIKNKKIKMSLYLIHLRLAAQGTLISCMTLGLLYSICKNNLGKLFPDKKN